jgi:predicted Zn-dependent protease
VDAPGVSLQQIQKAIDTGHPDDALAQVARLRAQHAAMPGLAREQGMAFYAKNDLHGADAAFAEAVKENAADREAAQMRGLTLFRLGRPADAIPLLESSRGAGMTKTDPNYVLALCYMDTRRYDDERRAFAAQYGFAPESAPAYLVAARMLLRREYLPIAQDFAHKALAVDASLPMAHELLGEIALAQGKLDEAIAELEAERTRNPLEGQVYDRLGDAYVRAGKYDEAQRTLQQAVLLEPNATGPYILLGKTMLKKGDAVGAATFLEHAREMDPANYMTHSLLGQAYRAMGRADDAGRENKTAQTLQSAGEPKLDGAK